MSCYARCHPELNVIPSEVEGSHYIIKEESL